MSLLENTGLILGANLKHILVCAPSVGYPEYSWSG